MKIVSIALNVPGPVAVARLVAEGARAIKVEPPWGDPLHGLCTRWYDDLHRGVEVEREIGDVSNVDEVCRDMNEQAGTRRGQPRMQKRHEPRAFEPFQGVAHMK